MVFSSLSFMFIFLPILIIFYYIIPFKGNNAKQYILLVFSLIFYGLGEPLYIILIAVCISISWVLARYVEVHQKWALIMSILVNVIPLIITKYTAFIIEGINQLVIIDIEIPHITMPIGISFYTFQVITYLVDLYKGKIQRNSNLFLFALYIMFFPQLVAGPIVKYSEIHDLLYNPELSWKNIKYGVGRFIIGLGKKVLIANQVGYISSTIQDTPTSLLTTGMTWLSVVAYSIQIYFDFSGYSEMAIGLGSILGFHLPENFNDPYTAVSISDFWKKWHITLGRFFREYLYIPMGGNRVGKIKWVFNILVVWSLTGLWHGASWNFVMWGLYFGILLVIERCLGKIIKPPKFFSWVLTSILVVFGWSIFMCDSIPLKEMFDFLGKLVFFDGVVSNPVTISSLKLWGYIPFMIIGFIISTPLWSKVLRKKIVVLKETDNIVIGLINDLWLISILILSLMFLIGGTYNPFIYFRF